MPKEQSDAMKAVYAYCRKTDDIVDNIEETDEQKTSNLSEWKSELENALTGGSKISLLNELSHAIKKFKIPHEPFFQLIEGVQLDLHKSRFETFEELKDYCYKVASTVGLMTIPILGYENSETEKYAVNLGIALQLTNIIRDVKVDAENGRIYLPLEDLGNFNYSEEEIFENAYNDHFIRLMKFQSDRAREYYEMADKYLSRKDRSKMYTARSMEYIYYRLLDKIEQENFNVYKHKIRVSTFNKLFISLGVWLKYKLLS